MWWCWSHHAHIQTASPVSPHPLAISLGETLTSSGSFHSISGNCNPLLCLPMKTNLVGDSGQREEASKEKEMCGMESLNRQGNMDSNREDGRATLILTLTLSNVRKTELSKAAKVFEVQTSPFASFTETSSVPIASTSPTLHLTLSYSSLAPCLICASTCLPPFSLSLLCYRYPERLANLSRWRRRVLWREGATGHSHLEAS